MNTGQRREEVERASFSTGAGEPKIDLGSPDPALRSKQITLFLRVDRQGYACPSLKVIGVKIAMDDLGTGYSSLSYLQSFPFDKIKIDQTFISNLHRNPQSAAIVRAVIGLGRGLQSHLGETALDQHVDGVRAGWDLWLDRLLI